MGIKYTDGGERLTCFGAGGSAVWIEPGKHPPLPGVPAPKGPRGCENRYPRNYFRKIKG